MEFSKLLARHRTGWSLEQPFYLDPTIYERERKDWFRRQWSVLAHVSELPRKGSRIVRELFGEEILLVKAGEDDYRAYFNVCTHRGSRLCGEDGSGPMLVCPYHAWSFRLTGELQTKNDLPDGVDPQELGLHSVPLRNLGGLLLGGLDESAIPDIAPLDAMLNAMALHGFDTAKIAHRQSYQTDANWKLVLENFFECYHCRPSHPEYFRSNGHVSLSAINDEAAGEAWSKEVDQWRATAQGAGLYHNLRETGDIDTLPFAVYRQPIGNDRKSLSPDGEPVSSLMGNFQAFDGGETAFHFGRFSFAGATNDHITLFQMVPRGPQSTDVIVTWFIAPDAPENIDIGALTWMWDVTTKQDKKIIEINAAGVKSSAYRPGPYTKLESQTANFVNTYVDTMKELDRDAQ